jgi:hypothetical protein
MTTKTQTFRHLIGGGFASDFGPSADVGPNNAGDVVFPYLIEAENVFFELDGGPHKVGGATKLNSVVINSGEEIRGMFDFWRHGTAGTPTQQRVVYSGTTIQADAADGTFASIKTGLTDNAVPCFTEFSDDLIMSSDSTTDVPLTYDQTSVTNLGGTPPPFAFSAVHKNRVWAAGDATQPSRLYYCKTLDANNWTHATAGFIDIDPDDGDRITAIASHKNDLWVFKGPYKGSIHRVTGSSNTGSDAFNLINFIRGLGAVSHNTLFRFRDDLGFMWADGTIHSLAATAAYGDFNEAALSRPIHKYIGEHVNLTFLRRAWAATDVRRNQVAFSLPIDTSSFCNQILIMDFSRQAVWWSKVPAYPANCVARVVDNLQSSLPILMIGGQDGYVRRTNIANRSIDGATAIAARVDTPYTNYGSAGTTKTLAGASVGIAPKGNFDLRFGWTRDDNAQQTLTIDQGGGDVLGPADANEFTLDTSQLAGSQYVDRFLQMEEGGEFRSISYQVYNAGLDEDMEVHSISTSINIGAWSSERNLSGA